MTEYQAALETLRDGKVKKVIPITEAV